MPETLSHPRIGGNYLVSFLPNFSWDKTKQVSGFITTERLSKIITKKTYSPAVFQDGYRAERNFLFADWAIFDFDEHRDIAQIAKELIDYKYIIAPTKSHSEQHHRFRVCIPFEKRISCIHQYRHNMATLIERFEADPQCKDAARFFWPSIAIYAINVDGLEMEVEDAPRRRVHEPTKLVRPSDAVMSDRVCKTIERGFDQGNRDRGLFGLAKDLYRDGFNWTEIERILLNVRTTPKFDADIIAKKVRSAKKSIEKEGG